MRLAGSWPPFNTYTHTHTHAHRGYTHEIKIGSFNLKNMVVSLAFMSSICSLVVVYSTNDWSAQNLCWTHIYPHHSHMLYLISTEVYTIKEVVIVWTVVLTIFPTTMALPLTGWIRIHPHLWSQVLGPHSPRPRADGFSKCRWDRHAQCYIIINCITCHSG